MNNKSFWRRSISIFCLLALCFSNPSFVSAAEESSGETVEGETVDSSEETDAETEEEERPEPDAYFEPIQTDAISGWPAGPPVWAESAVVMDLDSGAFLYSKNMDAVKYPASITKIMTTLLAIENSRLDERVTFSEHAIFGIERDSSHIGIRVGEILSMEECLYGMMLESANEVCLAVAEHIGGSVEGFVEMMNQKAAELGCTNTHFTNPNGLPDENHYTTARDMALIAKAAYDNKIFRKVCGTNYYKIPKTNVCGEERWLNNHHKMLPEKDYTYEGCTGGKTGFTQVAWNTLVTYAERNGRRLVCVSLRTNGAQYYIDTASLLDYGFNNFQNVTLYDRSTNPGASMRYPSYYFGQAVTIDTLRPTTVVTIPVSATPDQIETAGSAAPGILGRTYYYNQYQVGSESLPSASVQVLMTPVTSGSETTDENASGNDTINLPQEPLESLKQVSWISDVLDTLKQIPFYIYLLVVLLVAVIIMEIVISVRKRKRRKKRKGKHSQK
ncbi:MAG: D-alanyl-D-alanine carboxypeptidase [Clostridiales bacterium]|nr:D-alanyl-D-alanine carboxypeptidase [Clostridiales bacterium]